MAKRIVGLVILVACIAVAGGGAWILWGRDYFLGDVASDDDDDTDDDDLAVDGGAAHHAPPHGKGGKGAHHGKRSGVRKAASATHHGGGGGSAPAGFTGPGGPSYESAIAGNTQQIAIGAAAGAPDLTDAQLAGPMRNGTFLGACSTPDSMHVTVKVAIRGGRAAGVSVYTNPPSPQIAWCIDHSVRNLAWPVNGKMDSFVTTY